jgi:gas vesicle protein
VDSKGRTILLGVVLGAATGLAAALLLNRRAERDSRTTAITSGEGLKLGIMVFGLLRAIASLGDDEKHT